MNRRLRRQLNATGKQPCEVCLEQQILVQHHILGRQIDRAHEHSNLANVCSNCHVKIHKGEIIIEKRAMTTNGYVLLWHKKTAESITGEDAQIYTY